MRGIPEGGRRLGACPVPTPHRGRTWVTRAGLDVDRVACAWLIRRFIDPAASFRFVDEPRAVAARDELGFAMPDAEFASEAGRCTFEVLLERFDLDAPALGAIGEIVHDLATGEARYGRVETPAIGHLLAGLSASYPDDLVRIPRASALFDSLYAVNWDRPGALDRIPGAPGRPPDGG